MVLTTIRSSTITINVCKDEDVYVLLARGLHPKTSWVWVSLAHPTPRPARRAAPHLDEDDQGVGHDEGHAEVLAGVDEPHQLGLERPGPRAPRQHVPPQAVRPQAVRPARPPVSAPSSGRRGGEASAAPGGSRPGAAGGGGGGRARTLLEEPRAVEDGDAVGAQQRPLDEVPQPHGGRRPGGPSAAVSCPTLPPPTAHGLVVPGRPFGLSTSQPGRKPEGCSRNSAGAAGRSRGPQAVKPEGGGLQSTLTG